MYQVCRLCLALKCIAKSYKKVSIWKYITWAFSEGNVCSKWTRFMCYERRAVNTGNKTWITMRIVKSLPLSVRENRILPNWPLTQITRSPSFMLMCTARVALSQVLYFTEDLRSDWLNDWLWSSGSHGQNPCSMIIMQLQKYYANLHHLSETNWTPIVCLALARIPD